jgi:thiol-disulfide isomerase/thioredoxin
MNKLFSACVILLTLFSCSPGKEKPEPLKTGVWRGVIEIQKKQLPFNFEVVNDQQGGYDIYIRNAEEKLLLDEVDVSDDSVDIAVHIFDANFKAALHGDTLTGVFVKNYEKDYRLPFYAVYGQAYRFETGNDQANIPNFNGKYEVTFAGDTTKAIGIFDQKGDSVTGTFLTETGDYRFLQGNVADSVLQLSTFDGNHAYLFTATMQTDGKLQGEFYSGKTFHDTWVGEKNEKAALADPESLTYLKKGFEKIEFSFPDVNGNKVTLNDEKYRNKVVILQLFGTWCPNCLDETLFLSPWYDKNKHRGVEIIGLAYERKSDFDYASKRVKKMIDKLDVKYDFVIAGINDKASASKTLPQLNEIAAFPTTIFIGKDGKVKKIHTGFSGPGTGVYYDQFIEHFNITVDELLNESI